MAGGKRASCVTGLLARGGKIKRGLLLTILATSALVIGCGESYGGPPPGAFLGRAGLYDYSPTGIQSGNQQQFWWCGEGKNPNKLSQYSDTILYASIDLTTHQMYGPLTVLAETPGAWDSFYTCNPKVIRGTFRNPLGDGQTYTYAMYYVGTASPAGMANSIGVAFSQDGISWVKYPQPVITASTQVNYGVGQPAVFNADGHSGIWLFYEDANAPPFNQHIRTTSTDGVHFTNAGTLTSNGLPAGESWGDMAYDPQTGFWYALFNEPLRDPSTTGGNSERGQMGIALYRIQNDSMMSGSTPWQMLESIDSNLTGHESNFLGGFLRDPYGNLDFGSYPELEILTSMSNPPPGWNADADAAGKSATVNFWDIGKIEWSASTSPLALNQYSNRRATLVTTGWVDPQGNFEQQATLGHLYPGPQDGATLAFYGCKGGSQDYFLSTDSTCGGQHVQGIDGYGYSDPYPSTIPLYSCYSGSGHFVSATADCGGGGNGTLLGFALP